LQAIGPLKSCLICTFGCLQQSCCWPESPRYLQLVNQHLNHHLQQGRDSSSGALAQYPVAFGDGRGEQTSNRNAKTLGMDSYSDPNKPIHAELLV